MFILNNIHDRPYRLIYPELEDPIFDISDLQLGNKRNSDWYKIEPGCLVCVVTSTRKISTFYKVESKVDSYKYDAESGAQHVILGKVVAKLKPEESMTRILNRNKVNHSMLRDNKFSIGFNVADLGGALNDLQVKTEHGVITLETLETR